MNTGDIFVSPAQQDAVFPQPKPTMTVEQFFGLPRALRRKIYRGYLKKFNVPKPVFALLSATRNFNRLNFLTFLQDLHNASQKAPQKIEATEASSSVGEITPESIAQAVSSVETKSNE